MNGCEKQMKERERQIKGCDEQKGMWWETKGYKEQMQRFNLQMKECDEQMKRWNEQMKGCKDQIKWYVEKKRMWRSNKAI
jgi:hypothetical protein